MTTSSDGRYKKSHFAKILNEVLVAATKRGQLPLTSTENEIIY